MKKFHSLSFYCVIVKTVATIPKTINETAKHTHAFALVSFPFLLLYDTSKRTKQHQQVNPNITTTMRPTNKAFIVMSSYIMRFLSCIWQVRLVQRQSQINIQAPMLIMGIPQSHVSGKDRSRFRLIQ